MNLPQAIESLASQVATLEQKIDDVQGLVAKAYENTPRAAADLLRARRDPAYDSAYEGDPLVTVRIGAYKGVETLFERALDSVLRQTYSNWEAIIVCDGRDDETASRVAALGDERVICVQRPRNGPYPSEAVPRWQVAGSHPFNHGVALANGAWIAPIDQDDEWTESHLAVLVRHAQTTRAELVFGATRVLVGDDAETFFGKWPPALADFGFQGAIYHGGLSFFTYDVNSHLLNEPADWNLARRMLEAGVCAEFVDQIVTTYYVDRGSREFDWWMRRCRDRGPYEYTFQE